MTGGQIGVLKGRLASLRSRYGRELSLELDAELDGVVLDPLKALRVEEALAVDVLDGPRAVGPGVPAVHDPSVGVAGRR